MSLEEHEIAELAALLKAVADPTRLMMLSSIAETKWGAHGVHLQAVTALSQATIRHHLTKLHEAGLIDQVPGTYPVRYTLNKDRMAQLLALLRQLGPQPRTASRVPQQSRPSV